jgi:SAM-dependent methyltransferase
MLQMNYWGEKWDLHVNVCPCDVHVNEWIEARKLVGKTIYHFGTGTHHVVGRRQAELGNAVLAITASKEEHEAYVALVTENALLAKSYVAYFGDIYLTNRDLLPDFDVVTMVHLCEFSHPNTASAEYGGLTDRQLLDLFTAKTRPGGHLLFYTGSKDFEKAEPVIAAWAREQPVERVEEFKTLWVYHKAR